MKPIEDTYPFQVIGTKWSIIPVKEDKTAYVRWSEFQSRRASNEEITAWQEKYEPEAWAVVTGAVSGLIVLDFDGEAGMATLRKLEIEPHVQTGSGGFHLYVEYPGFKVRTLNHNTSLRLGERFPGMDIRADGGYAVCCGRNQRGTYEWLREPELVPISALPEELRVAFGLEKQDGEFEADAYAPACDFGDSVTYTRIDSDTLLETALSAAQFGRNNAGFSLACQLRDNRFTKEEAEEIMRRYQSQVPRVNAKGCEEEYTIEAALASLGQAFNGAIRAPLPVAETKTRILHPAPLGEDAFHGLAGEIIRFIEPHTEADPAALLFTFLTAFGNVIGRSAYFKAEADEHHTNLFMVNTGLTSKGRKGTSLGYILRIFELVDADWKSDRIQSGLSSGEGFIFAVRDPIARTEPIREGKDIKGYRDVVIDQGVADKRLLVIESEFAGALHVMGRDGSTLSAEIRNAWDTGHLRILTKNSPIRATGTHISIVGHITKDELLRDLTSTEAGNGFANRFLWVYSQRSKILPEGGNIDEDGLKILADRLREVVTFAKDIGELRRDENARRLWREVYPELSEGKPGLLGAVTARAEAQVMRVACIYALLDKSSAIEEEHLRAALAVWKYAEESAKFIFGDALGNPLADEILELLRQHPEGVSRTDINDHFGRHKSQSQLQRSLSALLDHRLARYKVEPTAGRNIELWFYSKERS